MKKTVLITGGSEGIGFAFAKAYAQMGYSLILVARNMERLKECAHQLIQEYSISVDVKAYDLSCKENCEKLWNELRDQEISIWINNAGVGSVGEFTDISYDKIQKMLDLNIQALTMFSYEYLKKCKTQGFGTLINIASTGAFQPGPYIATYYASKSFVVQLTRAIAKEVKNPAIKVYCVCPGPIDTAFYEKSGDTISSYHMSADECVAYTMKHLKQKTMIIPGILNRFLYYVPSKWKMYFVLKKKSVTKD